MEVHHHPHVEKKRFKEYFLEFLMLFLAVTLGFFAENIREHIVEQKKAKEYAHTLFQDIVKDTLELQKTIKQYQHNIALLDTLQQLKKLYKDKLSDVDFYIFSLPALTAFRISFNDATMNQLINSGNLRYFRSLKLKEKISEYENTIKSFLLRQDFEMVVAAEIEKFSGNLYNYEKLLVLRGAMADKYTLDSLKKSNYSVLTDNKLLQNEFLNFCQGRKINWDRRIKDNLYPVLEVARDLILMLKQEYHFYDKE